MSSLHENRAPNITGVHTRPDRATVEELFGWLYNYALNLKYPDTGKIEQHDGDDGTLGGRVGEYRAVALIKCPADARMYVCVNVCMCNVRFAERF